MAKTYTYIAYDPDAAYGPTVLVKMVDPASAVALRRVILSVASGAGDFGLDAMIDTTMVGIDRFTLGLSFRDETPRLVGSGDPPRFDWRCTPDHWNEIAEMLVPLIDGTPGHQYLTDEGIDDVVVVVSVAEPDVELSLSSSK